MLFALPPETVHEMALKLISKGFIKEHRDLEYTQLEQVLFGVKFKNPLGLAAGFDKNGVAVSQWAAAGFSFFEIGTVTLHGQAGNPKPRMFRLPQDRAIINRLGFNNIGAQAVAANLAQSRSNIPFGINIGKSFITPVEQAAEEYKQCFSVLRGYGSYFTINVSSPNTPGLRTLQEKEKLKEIVGAIRASEISLPLFIKVAPDLELSALDDVIDVALDQHATGIIATNTTIRRDGLTTPINEGGGLSGKPLQALSNQVLAHLGRSCGRQLVLIGVGGIFTGEDLYQKIALGAHLCQVYTGWVYGGPNMVPDCMNELVRLMEARGYKKLEELRGSALA